MDLSVLKKCPKTSVKSAAFPPKIHFNREFFYYIIRAVQLSSCKTSQHEKFTGILGQESKPDVRSVLTGPMEKLSWCEHKNRRMARRELQSEPCTT